MKVGDCQFHSCNTCHEFFPSLKISSSSGECSRCSRDKHQPKLYSHENCMNPGPVPAELQDLTQVEELLISAVMPMMILYKLPHGQLGYSGHIVNLPQDVSSFASSLPWLPFELDVVLVRREGAGGSHKDIPVRWSRVLGALTWLKENNIYFRDIPLNHTALAQLPQDGDCSGLSTVTLEAQEGDEEITDVSDDLYNAFLPGSFVPVTHRKETEREIVQQAVSQAGSSAQPFPWPQVSSTPINEFQTVGYMTLAFPSPFPTGAADFSAPRVHPITI